MLNTFIKLDATYSIRQFMFASTRLSNTKTGKWNAQVQPPHFSKLATVRMKNPT